MVAVVKVGALQFKISEGDVITVDRPPVAEGQSMTLDKVLLFANGSDIRVGQPFVKNVKISAKVMKHVLDDKKIAFKFRRRKESKSIKGHRQQLATLNITKILAE